MSELVGILGPWLARECICNFRTRCLGMKDIPGILDSFYKRVVVENSVFWTDWVREGPVTEQIERRTARNRSNAVSTEGEHRGLLILSTILTHEEAHGLNKGTSHRTKSISRSDFGPSRYRQDAG